MRCAATVSLSITKQYFQPVGGGRQAGRWSRRGQTERLRQTDIWIDGEFKRGTEEKRGEN